MDRLTAMQVFVAVAQNGNFSATADQLDAAAQLADAFSSGELRVSHDQNLVLPWVPCDQLPDLWRQARKLGLARPHTRLLTDMIACPGGDYCALANARSLPVTLNTKQSVSCGLFPKRNCRNQNHHPK
jgi:sulfite reductase beta subunit-like hemoprotein